MDPATFSLETATTLISALTLFLSRLDSRRWRSAQIPKLRDSLIVLSATILSWAQNAESTNDVVRHWVNDGMPTSRMSEIFKRLVDTTETWHVAQALALGTSKIERAKLTQVRVIGEAERILSEGRTKPWQRVRHLLMLYGPELLQVIDAAIASRRRLLEEVTEERLRNATPGGLAETMKSLESTSQKLDLVSTVLSEYIREKFPPNW